MSEPQEDPLLARLSVLGEKTLAHYGVKGMHWGVRKKRDGSGSVKVKFRPTYTQDEKRGARVSTKAAKKTGGVTAKDSSGASQVRLAKLNTPLRRTVNGVVGTLPVWGSVGVGALGATAGLLAGSPSLVVGSMVGGGTALTAAQVHQVYKVFFQNYVNNPRVKLQTTLTPAEMAKYAVGKQLTKELLSDRGSARLTVNKGVTTVSVKDLEGRMLGDQSKVNVPKPPKPKAK